LCKIRSLPFCRAFFGSSPNSRERSDNISSAAKAGDNTITITSKPFKIFQEVEPAYILGDFDLKKTDKGFVITDVNKKPMREVNDFKREIGNAKGGIFIEGVYPNGELAYFAFGNE
jgi:hypothetical protein